MKNKKSILIGGLLVALLVIGVIGATNVYAQTPTTTPLHDGGPGGGRGRGLGQVELEAAAKVLGMTTDELSTALQLSLIHISEPTRLLSISYAVFCLKKKSSGI